MFAIIAAISFAMALVIHATGTATAAIFSVTSLAFAGFIWVALPMAGYGSGWPRTGDR